MHKKITLLLLLALVIAAMPNPLHSAQAQGTGVTFFSTQFNVVEETAKAKDILSKFSEGPVTFVPSEEGPMIDLLKAEAKAGKGKNDVVGALHGTFVSLPSDMLVNLADLEKEIDGKNKINASFADLGKLGTKDVQYYVPWMQATYIMAASKEALQYLPQGADINTLTWAQLAAWGKNIKDKTGKPGLGFPVKGLFNRFLQGYAWPSFTGGMVTTFKSKEAADMLKFMRDELWPYVNPESINYDFMQKPLLSGEVMVAFDHVARLKDAFDKSPDKFVAFPAPAGPKGRGYMPVVVGLAIPATSPNPKGAMSLIKFMLSPATQGAILKDLGFYPVVDGVDMKNLPAGLGAMAAAVKMQQDAKDSIPSLLPVGLGAKGGEINQIFKDAFTQVVFDKKDIDQVLTAQGAALQKLMTDTGAACWAPDPAGKGACQVK